MGSLPGNWRDRISIDPRIQGGEPCIRGTRIRVKVILGSLANGDSIEQVLAAWPQLTREDVQAALSIAAEEIP